MDAQPVINDKPDKLHNSIKCFFNFHPFFYINRLCAGSVLGGLRIDIGVSPNRHDGALAVAVDALAVGHAITGNQGN